MNFLKKLWTAVLGSADEEQDAHGMYLYVKCGRCGTPLQIRVDKRHDFQPNFSTGGYVLHKDIMDSTCFQLMHATVHFDARYHILTQELTGGEFITEEAYHALISAVDAEHNLSPAQISDHRRSDYANANNRCSLD